MLVGSVLASSIDSHDAMVPAAATMAAEASVAKMVCLMFIVVIIIVLFIFRKSF